MILKDWITGRVPFGVTRSPKWPALEKEFKKAHPACAVCGTTKKIEVHHQKPFHLNPNLELDPRNLISLCRPHHFTFGHFECWKSWNESVVSDASTWLKRVLGRPK